MAFGSSDQNGSQNNIAGTADMVYNQTSKCEYCSEYGHRYSDTDNDGICDYCTRTADSTAPYCRHELSSSGSGHHYGASDACGGTGHHAGRGYSHR